MGHYASEMGYPPEQLTPDEQAKVDAQVQATLDAWHKIERQQSIDKARGLLEREGFTVLPPNDSPVTS